ncbi:MAG: nucleotidyltransferase family protein [Pirellulaceae bacterium]
MNFEHHQDVRPFRSFAVIPAAGKSVRMGQPKLLLRVGGKPILQRTFEAFDGNVSRTVVVIRHADTRLHSFLQHQNVDVVRLPDDTPDMKQTVQRGIDFIRDAYAPVDTDVWLLAPADLPLLEPAAVATLLAHYRRNQNQNQEQVLVASHHGTTGHPVLLPWSWASRLGELSSDQGIRDLWRANDIVQVECGPSAIRPDVDTPEDLAAIQRWPADH